MINRFAVQHKFSEKNIAIVFVLIVCCVLSFVPICVKWSEQEISPIATVFDRFFFGAFIFGLSSVVFPNQQKTDTEATVSRFYTPKIILLLLGAGTCAAANQAFWALSLTQTNVGNSSLMHSLSPLFTTLLAWLFLQRSFDRQFIIGMAIAIVGSIAISIGDFQIAITKLQGDELALLSAIFFAIYLLIVEQLRISLSSSTILFWRCLLGTVFLLPILLINGDRLMPNSTTGWLAIACLVLTFVIGHGLLTYTLNILSSSLVAVILLLDPFLSSLQAWIFFSEKLSLLEGISFAIVVLGVYLAISSRDRKIGVSE
ncbi:MULTISPECIES: DMT family transporter [Spirulina sp. CCY15215]|uniref:DMT family transporter n=1 Tax=Spirulina sp. CCY15215 TaxID=2767591 RepID=UPI0019515FDA|nr:DMT family transporter [Spirulina major]